MLKLVRTIFVFVIPFVMMSCGERDPNANTDKDKDKNNNNTNNANNGNSLSTQALAGKIDGTPFSFQSGFATQTNQGWQIYLYNEANNDPCDMFKRHGALYIGFTSSLQLGQVTQSVSLGSKADTNQPHINVTQGTVVIDQTSDTKAFGRMTASLNDQSAVQGSFSVTKCSGTSIRQ